MITKEQIEELETREWQFVKSAKTDEEFALIKEEEIRALIARVRELEAERADAWDEGVLATEEGMQIGLAEFGPNPYRKDGE